MNVETYIDRASRSPWAWGGGIDGWRGHDCTLFAAANWPVALGCPDPADDMRGRYGTREEAEAIVTKAGGFVPLIGARLISLGWRSVETPSDGDIGVISIPLGQGQHFHVPGVFALGKWITADPKRLLPFPGKVHSLMVWRAP